MGGIDSYKATHGETDEINFFLGQSVYKIDGELG